MFISSDTNIWVDFQTIDALELPFKLSHKFYLSEEALREELITPPGIDENLVKFGLIALELTEEEFFNASDITEKHPRLSRYDALALAIAIKRKYILLTGDKELRKVAETEGVVVRGTIWVFDELLVENIITREEYINFMKDLKSNNGRKVRLPATEIEKRIK